MAFLHPRRCMRALPLPCAVIALVVASGGMTLALRSTHQPLPAVKTAPRDEPAQAERAGNQPSPEPGGGAPRSTHVAGPARLSEDTAQQAPATSSGETTPEASASDPADKPKRTTASDAREREQRTFGGRPIEKARTITMEVTAYSPDARSCGKWADGQTASGYSVYTNGMHLVAADTDLLPFGSIVSIPGYDDGEPVPVLDRGGAIKGKRLDVLFPTHERAMQWGRQTLTVTVWRYADDTNQQSARTAAAR